MSGHLLEIAGISKTYGATTALSGVSLTVRRGCVHGLMGGNGAGKSTLMKIVCGAIKPSSGTITWHGRPVSWPAPKDAASAGISTVHQHIPLAPSLSVLENTFLSEKGWRRTHRDLRQRYRSVSERIGYHIDPDVRVGSLAIGERQMVAIMQAIASDAALIILDEPTASLAVREREHLFSAVKQLADEGTAFLFCSHFLGEILTATEEVTVLRDGRVVLTEPTKSVDEDQLVRAIAGRPLYAREHQPTSGDAPPTSEPRRPVLQASDVRLHPGAKPINVTIMPGEIVGVAGLMGSGRSRLLRTLVADQRPTEGTLQLNGAAYPRSVSAAIRRGVAYLPEDRNSSGVIGDWTVWQNLTLPYLASFCSRGFLRRDREKRHARHAVANLGVKTASIETPVGELSGGNAQKVSLGRWLRANVDLLLLDEPTVGVDVGAKADILDAVSKMALENDTAVLWASSDLEELLALAPRLLVMGRGSVVHDLATADLSEGDVVALMSGLSARPNKEQS